MTILHNRPVDDDIDDDIDGPADQPEQVTPTYLHPTAARFAAMSFGAAVASILGGIGRIAVTDDSAVVTAIVAVLVAAVFVAMALFTSKFAVKDDGDYLVAEYIDGPGQ